MMEISHGVIWFAPIPKCPTHGQMKFDMPTDRYICMGYDGEGCDYFIDMEAIWSPLGTTDLCHRRKRSQYSPRNKTPD